MGEAALRHALMLALRARSHFTLLHIDAEETKDGFDDFPHIRPLLAQWGLLSADSPTERVQELGLFVKKVRAASGNPAQAVVQHLSTHPADLVVLATHRRGALNRWLHRPVAEPIARGVRAATLFLPEDCQGFVREADGQVALRRILLPVSQSDTAQLAADAAAELGTLLACQALEIHVVHVDDTHLTPAFRPPERPGWSWQATRTRGDVVPAILSAVRDVQADLIVMTTEGHTTWEDTFLGSTTEQVLRHATCPLFAIPAH